MKYTIIARREFSINGFKFRPGDEVDLHLLGKTNYEFRSLVHARFIGYGEPVRTFDEIMKEYGYAVKPNGEMFKIPEETEEEAEANKSKQNQTNTSDKRTQQPSKKNK